MRTPSSGEYSSVQRSIQAHDVEQTKTALRSHFSDLRGTADQAGEQQRRRIAKLQDRRRELLHLHYEQAIPLDLFREEQAQLSREIEAAERILGAIDAEFRGTEEILLQALDLGRDIDGLYLQAANDPELRRMMNQLFFERIEVEVDGTVHAELAAPFADIRAGRIVERVKDAITALQGTLEAANPATFSTARVRTRFK